MNREELSALQEQAFNELKDEFSRLQQQEKALRKSAGLPESPSSPSSSLIHEPVHGAPVRAQPGCG